MVAIIDICSEYAVGAVGNCVRSLCFGIYIIPPKCCRTMTDLGFITMWMQRLLVSSKVLFYPRLGETLDGGSGFVA